MKGGGCGPLCGTRARRAAEDSLAAIRSVCPGRIGGTHGIIAELFPWQDQGASPAGIHERAAQRSASAMELPKMSNCFLKNGLVRGFQRCETEGLAEGTNKNVTFRPVLPDLPGSIFSALPVGMDLQDP